MIHPIYAGSHVLTLHSLRWLSDVTKTTRTTPVMRLLFYNQNKPTSMMIISYQHRPDSPDLVNDCFIFSQELLRRGHNMTTLKVERDRAGLRSSMFVSVQRWRPARAGVRTPPPPDREHHQQQCGGPALHQPGGPGAHTLLSLRRNSLTEAPGDFTISILLVTSLWWRAVRAVISVGQ